MTLKRQLSPPCGPPYIVVLNPNPSLCFSRWPQVTSQSASASGMVLSANPLTLCGPQKCRVLSLSNSRTNYFVTTLMARGPQIRHLDRQPPLWFQLLHLPRAHQHPLSTLMPGQQKMTTQVSRSSIKEVAFLYPSNGVYQVTNHHRNHLLKQTLWTMMRTMKTYQTKTWTCHGLIQFLNQKSPLPSDRARQQR